jgi:hypothetical protein
MSSSGMPIEKLGILALYMLLEFVVFNGRGE